MASQAYFLGMLIGRERLYEEVWAEPMLTVAKRYEVSSSFLARICRRLKVPCPPRGYWAKKAAGGKPKVPLLPPPEPGDELGWSRGWEAAPRQPYPAPSTQATGKGIPDRAVPPHGLHPLLVGVEAKLQEGSEMYNKYLRPSKRLLPDIYVTKSTVAYAVETANKLFKFLGGKGCRVDYSPQGLFFHRPELKHCEGKDGWASTWQHWHPARSTIVYIGTMPIGFTLFEYMERVEAQERNGKWIRLSDIPPPSGRKRYSAPSYYTSTHDFTTGRIAIRAYSPYEAVPWERYWVEPEVGGLPAMFDQITGSLKAHAAKLVPLVKAHLEKQRIEAERRAAEHQAWLKKRAIEEEQERLAALERARKQAIQDSKDELLDLMKRWDQAKRVQAFLAEVERLVEEAALEEQAKLWERLEQARAFLGEIDLPELFKRWKTPSERQASGPKPASESQPTRDRPTAQQQTEAELRSEVDVWKRRYIYGRR